MGYYPEAIFVPFIDTTILVTNTVSTFDFLARTAKNVSSALPTDVNIPQIISNLDAVGFASAGDDTAYDKTFQWIPPITGKVDKFFLNFAIIMNMSARTADDATFDDVIITITKGGEDVYYRETFATGLAALDATG